MANVEIIIAGSKMLHGTSVKETPELSSNSTPTFDGVITQGLDEVPYTIEMSKISYENASTTMDLEKLLEEMYSNPKMVTIRELVKPKGERAFWRIRNYHECVVSGNDYEVKPDDLTVHNLKFSASKRTRGYSWA